MIRVSSIFIPCCSEFARAKVSDLCKHYIISYSDNHFKKHSFLFVGNLPPNPLFPVPCSLFPVPYYLLFISVQPQMILIN
ncbi:MAG: hypothetical protein F6K56_22590 [Moorea sp. SIO3G5]|nr:hypothetical protein [Moorena sp. SIO3G5]